MKKESLIAFLQENLNKKFGTENLIDLLNNYTRISYD